jgi:hypothetical protein
MAAEGLVETRRAVQALRTDTLPLDEELALFTDTHAQRYHVPVSYDTGGVPAALPSDATLALLRIAQEALVNAASTPRGSPWRSVSTTVTPMSGSPSATTCPRARTPARRRT